MSKENSNVSTESLEYQDAPSPGEFEHVVMASKPASASTGLMTNPAEKTEDSDKDVFESVTALDLEKPTGKNSFPNIQNWLLMSLICNRIFSTIKKLWG